jgi:methionyl-tRNA synthetase
VVGKDIIRFHAVYWPAFLLSAGVPLPTTLNVHEFIQIDGEKISKSRGNSIDPARYNEDLGNDLGNLVNRSVSMLHRYREGVVPQVPPVAERESPLAEVASGLGDRVRVALDAFDFRQAVAAVWELVAAANRYIDDTKPWELAKAAEGGDETAGERLDAVLADLVETIRLLAVHLSPFIPDGAARIARQAGFELSAVADDGANAREWNQSLAGLSLPKATPIFPRIETEEK